MLRHGDEFGSQSARRAERRGTPAQSRCSTMLSLAQSGLTPMYGLCEMYTIRYLATVMALPGPPREDESVATTKGLDGTSFSAFVVRRRILWP